MSYFGTPYCTCGNSTFSHGDGKWCCGTNCTGGSCLRWGKKEKWVNGTWSIHGEDAKEGDHPKYCDEWLPAICTTGIALNLTESCGGFCNYYGEDKNRNFLDSRSYVSACSNTSICVKEGEGYRRTICTGDSSCEGELDWCREEERKEEKCPGESSYMNEFGYSKCPGISNIEGGNGKNFTLFQCIDLEKLGDGKENDCLDRSDEDPFQDVATGTNKDTIINFGSIKQCTELRFDGLGLECGEQKNSNCIYMGYWCDRSSQSWGIECPLLGLKTNDPTLCANNNFWRKLRCAKSESWKRCRAGESGQCVRRKNWGILGDKSSCRDGSDKYRPIIHPTESEKPGPQAKPADHNQHSNDGGEPEADARDSAEEESSQHSEVWKTKPVTEKVYNRKYKGKEEGSKYVKDLTTGWWMVAVSEETCKASGGFVCKVRSHNLYKYLLKCKGQWESGIDVTLADEDNN